MILEGMHYSNDCECENCQSVKVKGISRAKPQKTVEEIVEMIKNYDRFKCGACETKISNLSHTQFCQFREDIISLLLDVNNK